MELRGVHVVVTGASKGIGAELAKQFAAAGAKVSLVARSGDLLNTLADEGGGRAFVADLLDATQVDALVPRIEAEAGPIDVLINNAGLETNTWMHADEPAVLRDTVRLNLEAPVMLTRAVLPGMLQRGRGSVAYVSSLAGSAGFPGLVVYAATKAGLNNLAASLRLELRDTPVHVLLAAAGPVDTRMWDTLEDRNEFDGVLGRLNTLHLLPKKTPQAFARKIVRGVARDRRHVRVPRRLYPVYWLGESTRRIVEVVLARVRMVRT